MNNLARAVSATLCAGLFVLGASSAQAATIRIINTDAAGEGFNDPTPVSPEGGNQGATLGQQRLNALQFAADLVGENIGSAVDILVEADFSPQQCSPANATLAAAGATALVADFGAGRPDTFYPIALGNALAGRDLAAGPDISATFNSAIDNNDACLTGIDWYYGFDDNPTGNDLNFISTAAHELIHGLGFATFTNLVTGQFVDGTPDIYAVFVRDLLLGQNWPQLSALQRSISASNDGNLAWDGPSAISSGAPTLDGGVSSGRIRLFAPTPVQPGSSVSHWDSDVDPNALMEPFDTGDVFITEGTGLATCLLQDIGWTLINNTRCPDGNTVSGGNGGDGGPTVTEGEPPVVGGGGNPDTDEDADDDAGQSGGGTTTTGGGSSSSGGGGGCTLASGAPDPLFALMLLFAIAGLRYPRRTD